MWIVSTYLYEDLKDPEDYIIQKKDTWYEIGRYRDLETATSIMKHEINLYNYVAEITNDTRNPKFKIESNFDNEEE